jgi:endoglucanase
MQKILFPLLFLIAAPFWVHSSDWTDLVPITDRVMKLRFDDGYIIHHSYRESPTTDFIYNVPLNLVKAQNPQSFTIFSPDDDDYLVPLSPDSVGRKTKGDDFSKNCDNDPDKCPYVNKHYLFLHLPHPLKDGKTYTIELDGLAENYNSLSLGYSYIKTRSDAIKVNQRGYVPDAAKKFAYISYWMGDSGPLNLDEYAGNSFYVINIESGEKVFEGSINKRLDFESGNAQVDLLQANSPSFFAMADVWECDFSSFKAEGVYVIAVDEIGTSYPFKIDKDVYREAYYHSARALFHHRTGIPLDEQYTRWHRPRTLHPDDDVLSFEYTHSRWIDWGGRENGDRTEVLSLVDPDVGLTTWGWYMDAGDWDGYYSHTIIPRYLMMAFDLAPEKFADGELNIPESGNGIPDILDEAAWLIKYLDRTRGPSGGIAGARVHADFRGGTGEKPSWEDNRTWLISGEDYVTTYTFSGLAAYLAHCYRKIDRQDLADIWWGKALDAYNWANENVNLATDDLFSSRFYAAAAMYKYSGLAVFQNHYISDYNRTSDSNPRNNRNWAIWTYLTADHANINTSQRNTSLAAARNLADGEIVTTAETRGWRVGFNWYMPYVVGQPTTPAVFPALVMYYITGEEKYLTASQTSADYYLGGNPLNMLWMTGLGHNRPERVLHLDTWYHPERREEYPPGIVPYGPNVGYNWNSYIVYSGEFAYDRAYPDKSVWPPHELFFNNRYAVPTNEYTVHQNIAPAAAVYALLSSDTDGNFVPNKAPELTIVSPSHTDTFIEGEDIAIEVVAEDSDGMVIKVEYFHGRHKLGKSTTPPFTFVWENVPAGNPVLKVVAHDNEGARTTKYVAAVQSIELSKTSLTLEIDETYQLGVSVFPSYATNPEIFWSSADESIATVGSDGLITAVGKGIVEIVAEDELGDVKAICTVTVLDPTTVPEMKQEDGLKIYPNPTSGTFRIESLQQIRNVEIYDYTGRMVLNKYGENADAVNIDTNSWGKGLFLIKITLVSGEQKTGRLVVW